MALAAKAARGAGAPPAQAGLFGTAAALHLGEGRAPEDLEHALAQLPGGAILRFPLELHRLGLEMAQTKRIDSVMDAQGAPALAQSYLETLPCDVTVRVLSPQTLKVVLDATHAMPARCLGRIDGCDRLLARMTALAARTFVPESDASREAGAGAGLSDND